MPSPRIGEWGDERGIRGGWEEMLQTSTRLLSLLFGGVAGGWRNWNQGYPFGFGLELGNSLWPG